MKTFRSSSVLFPLGLVTSILWLGCGAGDHSTNENPFLVDQPHDNPETAGNAGSGGSDQGPPNGRPPPGTPHGGSGGSAGEAPPQSCTYDLDCTLPESRCERVECVENACVVSPLSKDLVPNMQQAGDCKRVRCDGAGNEVLENNDADVPEDEIANACVIHSCSGGEPQSSFAPVGSLCKEGVCDGHGSCSACVPSSRTCVDGQTMQVCGEDGQWQDGVVCGSHTSVCSSGQCVAVLDLAAGSDNTCAVLSSGAVHCWGADTYGQLGHGSLGTSSAKPVRIEGLESSWQVTIGKRHLCAVQYDDSIRCWGDNTFGQLGVSPAQTTLSKAVSPAASDLVVKTISAGDQFTCALRTNGKVACWGKNDKGQLGRPAPSFDPEPVDVPTLSDVVALGAGSDFACAVTGSAAVYCWGANDRGQLGRLQNTPGWMPTMIYGIEKVSSRLVVAPKHACVLDEVGQVYCWGDNSNWQINSNIYGKVPLPTLTTLLNESPIRELVSGETFTCVYNESPLQLGFVGANDNGQLLASIIDLSFANWLTKKQLDTKLFRVGVGDRHGCMLNTKGEVACWGAGDRGQNGSDHNLEALTPITW